jgi:hypothetical protein
MVKMRRQIFFCVTLTEKYADNPFFDKQYMQAVHKAFDGKTSELRGYVEKVEVVMMNDGPLENM